VIFQAGKSQGKSRSTCPRVTGAGLMLGDPPSKLKKLSGGGSNVSQGDATRRGCSNRTAQFSAEGVPPKKEKNREGKGRVTWIQNR